MGSLIFEVLLEKKSQKTSLQKVQETTSHEASFAVIIHWSWKAKLLAKSYDIK